MCIPHSLDITPPSFISPPLLFSWICCRGIFISNLCPPQRLQLWWMRERSELIVPPYIRSLATCILASDTPTKRFATRRRARISLVVVRKVCVFWPLTLCAFISWSFALPNWATMSFIAIRMRRWRTILPLLFPSWAHQQGRGVCKQH